MFAFLFTVPVNYEMIAPQMSNSSLPLEFAIFGTLTVPVQRPKKMRETNGRKKKSINLEKNECFSFAQIFTLNKLTPYFTRVLWMSAARDTRLHH